MKAAINNQGLPWTASRMPVPRITPMAIQTANAKTNFMRSILALSAPVSTAELSSCQLERVWFGEKKLASTPCFPHHRPEHFAGLTRFDMKAKIIITPKKAVVDPQGKAVQNALAHLGYNAINAVHVGKYLEIELNGADPETARRQLDEACHKFLSNPVIEDYKLDVE